MYKTTLYALCLLVGVVWCLPEGAIADVSYFDQNIDYWSARSNQNQNLQPSNSKNADAPAAFNWQKYLDPKSDDFFREGDYTPPAPFMEVARNPSDENLRNWFAYIATKNAVAARLSSRMEAFTQAKFQDPSAVDHSANIPIEVKKGEPINIERFFIRFYFDSQCPHCQRMAREIEKLRRLGFQIEARPPLKVPVQYATAEELHRIGIQSVPMLLIADQQGKGVYRVSGYQSAEAVMQGLSGK